MTDLAAGASASEWLSTQEAASRLGVVVRTLYRLIDSGELPAYKIGRVIRLQRSDVDDYIARCRIAPGALEHLYPEVRGDSELRATPGNDTTDSAPERT